MIIVYTIFEGKVVPILGEELVQDPILEDNFLIKGVHGVTEGAHPHIHITGLSTSKSNVSSYAIGEMNTPPEKVEETKSGEVVAASFSTGGVQKTPIDRKSENKKKISRKEKRKRATIKN